MTEPAPAGGPPRRRWPRRLLFATLGIVLLIPAALLLLRLEPVATWAGRRLAGLAPLAPGARLSIGRVGGNWISGLTLDDVVLARNGEQLVAIRSARVHYDLRRLLGADRRLRLLEIDGLRVHARREADGWDLGKAFLTSADTSAPGGSFGIGRLVLRDGSIVAELTPDSVARAERVELRAADLVVAEVTTIAFDTLGARISPPTTPRTWLTLAASGAALADVVRLDTLRLAGPRSRLSGRAVVPRTFEDERIIDRLDIDLRGEPLALADVAGIVPAVSPAGELELRLRARAEGRRATGRLDAAVGAGRVALTGATLLGPGAPAEYRLNGEVRELDPSLLAAGAPAGKINANVAADIRGPALDSADGRIEVRLDDAEIAATRVGDLRLIAELRRGRADLDLRGSVEDGTFAARGWARPFDSTPSYRLAGSASSLPGTDNLAGLLAGREGDPRLEIGFRVTGRGATAAAADLSGRASLTALRSGGGRTPLGSVTLEVAERRLHLRPDLRVAGGRIAADVSARLDDPMTYDLRRGTIERVDLGRLLQDTVAAPLSGRFALRGAGTEPATATVRADLALDTLRYGDRLLESVTARVSLERGRAALTLRGRVQGGALLAEGEVRPFDSVPSYSLRRAAVERIDLGTLLGRPDLAGSFSATLTGAGRWGARIDQRGFRGRMHIAPSTLGGIALRTGQATMTLASGRLRYDGAVETSAGALALAGDARPLDAAPSYTVRSGRLDSLDLGALLDRAGLSTRIDARFEARAQGMLPDSGHARLAMDLLPSRINQAEVRSARLDLTLADGALQGDLRADAEDGDLVARLQGEIAGLERRLRAEGALRIDRLARWTGDTTRDGSLTGRFTLDGAADSVGLLGLAGTITANGRIDSLRLDTLQIALSPAPRALRFDTLVVRSNAAAFDGGGRLALRDEATSDTLRILGHLLDPMPLVTLAGADSMSLDSARVRLTVAGPGGRRRIAVDGAVHRVLYAGSQVERLLLRGAADIDSSGLAGAAGEARVEGGATGSIVVREAQLAARYDSVVSLQAHALLRDSIAIDVALAGTAEGDTIRGTLQRLDLVEGGRSWSLERPAAFTVQPPKLALDRFALRAGSSRLDIDGVLDRRGESDLALELRDFDLDPLQKTGFAPFGGTLNGRARLTGPAAAPSLDGRMLAVIRDERAEESGRMGARVQWTADGLRLEAAATPTAGGRLTVSGTLPLRLTLAPADTSAAVGITRAEGDTLGLVVQADSFDLAFFQPLMPEGTAEDLRGALVADGRISGTMERPRADGTIALRGFAATLPALGVSYRQGELLGRLAGDRLALERLHLESDNDGTLDVEGGVLLAPLTDPRLDLDARLDEFRVSHTNTLRTIASGRLELGGSAAVPVMTGTLTLGRTDIFSGTGTAAAANVEEVQLTAADLQQLAREFGPSVLARANEAPGLVDRFRLDLDVRLPRQVWFRQRGNMKSDIEIFGRVRVRQEPGEEMGFFGKVEPVPGRGVLELYGREFRLQEGEITLAGPAETVTLDVTAQYQVLTQADPGDEGILIDVQASGRADSLELEFSSEPAMSEDDIVSYIVTGRPASENPLASEETGEGPGAAEAGAEVALGRLSESVAGAAGAGLGLDVFQIRQDGLRGLTLTAGRYVGSRLFLSLQQPIQLRSEARGQSSASMGPGFELEYGLRRWLRANLRGGNVPPRFFVRGRHAF